MNFREYLEKRSMNINLLSKETRIPYATLHSGIENPQMIKAENLNKLAKALGLSMDEVFALLSKEKSNKLYNLIKEQKDTKLKGSLYHKTQVNFTYNTNRIEGSKLTEDETRMIFETNSIIGSNKITNSNDIVETSNHFHLFDVMIDEALMMLTEDMIKKYHMILKNGTVDARKDWFAIGDYKKHENEVGGMETTKPKEVATEMKRLFNWYRDIEKVALKDIVEFHYRFECIHPFQDGNGRIGRLIMFKECLKNNIMPFIVEDEIKAFYYRGLAEYKHEQGYLMDTLLAMQDKYKALVNKFVGELL